MKKIWTLFPFSENFENPRGDSNDEYSGATPYKLCQLIVLSTSPHEFVSNGF